MNPIRSHNASGASLHPPSHSRRSESAFYSEPVDARVRCRECGCWTGKVGVANRYIIGGSVEMEWYDVRTCRLRKGHDPDIMRHCEYYIPRRG